MRPRHPFAASRTARWLGLLLLLMAFALPRVVVQCHGTHCAGSVRWSFAERTCCAVPAPQPQGTCCSERACSKPPAPQRPARGEWLQASGCDCVDAAMDVGDWQLPGSEPLLTAVAVSAVPPRIAWPPLSAVRRSSPPPPATGPPRPDARIELRATTVLLL